MNTQPLKEQAAWLTHMAKNDDNQLTIRQLAVLVQLYVLNQQGSVRDFAAALNLSKPAVTRALDRLEEIDLLRRNTSKDDRREIELLKTPKGQAFIESFECFFGEASHV